MAAQTKARSARRKSRSHTGGPAPESGRKPIVLLLGMHRSGTSLCSHILSTLGVNMADEIGVGVGNDDGHWERWEIVTFHDRILALFNRDYLGPLHDLPLPPAWWADPQVAAIRQEMAAFIKPRIAQGLFGFKDPRTIRLLPVWQQLFEELDLAPRFVMSLRNPAQVAHSLHVRDGLPIATGEHRWLVYMVDFFRYAGNEDVCILQYDDWFTDPAATAKRLLDFLGLTWRQSRSDLEAMLAGVIKPQLRHERQAAPAALKLAARFYNLMQARTAKKDKINEAVSQFLEFQQLDQPLQRALEGFQARAAQLPQAEQRLRDMQALANDYAASQSRSETESADLRAALTTSQAIAEREKSMGAQRISELQAQAQENAAALSDAALEKANLEQRIQDLTSLTDGYVASLSQIENETGDLRAALARHETELAAERTARAEKAAADVELQDLRSAMAAHDAEKDALLKALAVANTLSQDERQAARQLRADMESQQDVWRRKHDDILARMHAQEANARLSLEKAETKRITELKAAGEALQGVRASLAEAQNVIIQLEAMRKQGEAMVAQLKEQDDEIVALKNEKVSLRIAIEQAHRVTRDHGHTETQLRGDIAALQEAVNSVQETAAGYLVELAQQKQQSRSLESERNEEAEAARTLRADLAALATDLEASQSAGRSLAAAFRASLPADQPKAPLLSLVLHILMFWRRAGS